MIAEAHKPLRKYEQMGAYYAMNRGFGITILSASGVVHKGVRGSLCLCRGGGGECVCGVVWEWK